MNDIGNKLRNAGMIPVFYHADVDTCKKVIKACYDGGIRVFEYVNRGDAALKNFPILLDYVHSTFPDMVLGIGSIITKEHAEQFIKVNPDFIVAPILDEEVAEVCSNNNKYWIPGCATLSEIAKAEKLGADIIKIFPGNVLGPEFVKSVLGPMPWLKLMPTGGVETTKENLDAWYKAGVVCVGMGSNLLKKDLIEKPEQLTELVEKTMGIINAIKKN